MATAVMVLDIQKDFVGEKAKFPVARHQVDPLIQNLNKVITKARQENITVLYIGNEFGRDQFLTNCFRNFAAMKGTAGAALDERLKVKNDLYFSKSRGDALSNPGLVDFLRKGGFDHLIVTGVFTEGCVKATVQGAVRLGFKVTVLEDCVGSATDRKREKALRRLGQSGINLMNSNKALEGLSCS